MSYYLVTTASPDPDSDPIPVFEMRSDLDPVIKIGLIHIKAENPAEIELSLQYLLTKVIVQYKI